MQYIIIYQYIKSYIYIYMIYIYNIIYIHTQHDTTSEDLWSINQTLEVSKMPGFRDQVGIAKITGAAFVDGQKVLEVKEFTCSLVLWNPPGETPWI